MFKMIFRIVSFIVVSISLISCNGDLITGKPNPLSSINWQLKPDAPGERVINDVAVSYFVPGYISDYGLAEQKLLFEGFERGQPSRQEKLRTLIVSSDMYRVERRTDNGAAGSGRTFDVEISKKRLDRGTLVTFTAKKETTYQEGAIFPFAIPDFNIKKHLYGAEVSYGFEFNSNYNMDSVRSNFTRLLRKLGYDKYLMETGTSTSSHYVSFYNYRNGTKIVIKSKIRNMRPDSSGVINIDQAIKEVKERLASIVNA